jgi:simple sugar transport system permease protein
VSVAVEPKNPVLQRRWFAEGAPEYLWPVAALVASLATLAPLAAIAGADVLDAYSTLFSASFGTSSGAGFLLQYSVPLILIGLGVALPLRVGLFNLGAQGQLLLGALAAAAFGVEVTGTADSPGSFILPLACSLVAGALLGGIAGILKAWRGVNEIITTIMLNFVAALFVTYWVSGPFQDKSLGYSTSPSVDSGYSLGHMGQTAQIPTSIFVAIIVTAVVAYAVHFTRRGWRLHVAGENPNLAARHGFRVGRLYILAMVAGGALAGLGGGTEVIGNQLRVSDNFAPGWGFDALAIAVLARGNMIAVVPYALFYGFLSNGSGELQTNLGVPGSLVQVVAAAPIIIVAAVLGYRAYRQTQRA